MDFFSVLQEDFSMLKKKNLPIAIVRNNASKK